MRKSYLPLVLPLAFIGSVCFGADATESAAYGATRAFLDYLAEHMTAPSESRWIPGCQHPTKPNVVSGDTPGEWWPAPGFGFRKGDDETLTVERLYSYEQFELVAIALVHECERLKGSNEEHYNSCRSVEEQLWRFYSSVYEGNHRPTPIDTPNLPGLIQHIREGKK